MCPNEVSSPSEELLIDRITAGEAITAELLLDALDHCSPKELLIHLQERCPPGMVLPVETVHHLVGADPMLPQVRGCDTYPQRVAGACPLVRRGGCRPSHRRSFSEYLPHAGTRPT